MHGRSLSVTFLYSLQVVKHLPLLSYNGLTPHLLPDARCVDELATEAVRDSVSVRARASVTRALLSGSAAQEGAGRVSICIHRPEQISAKVGCYNQGRRGGSRSRR